MALTFEEIKEVLGPVDRDTASAIVATGATASELAEAWAWLQNDEALVNEGRSLPTGRVALLIDLLSPPADDEAS